jgi:hypothetical protein
VCPGSKTILDFCLSHGRREFVTVAPIFPPEAIFGATADREARPSEFIRTRSQKSRAGDSAASEKGEGPKKFGDAI